MTSGHSTMQPRRVLVYHIGSLGDTLMATPALWAVRRLWPDARITLLTKQTEQGHVVLGQALFEGTPMFDDVLMYPGLRHGRDPWIHKARQVAMLARLRWRRFDAVVYLAPTERQAAQVRRDERFFRLAGIAKRIGFDDFPTPPDRAARPLAMVRQEADALLGRLRGAGLPVPSIDRARLDLDIGPAETSFVHDWVAAQSASDGGRRWLAIGAGSNMPSKQWPASRFSQVVDRLIAEFDVWPVTFGGPEDRQPGDALLKAVGRGYNAAGQLDVRTAAAAMRRCVAYLGNDTGTMHLAASEGVPCVALFSARDFPGKWYPIGEAHQVLRRRTECEGCMLERCEAHAMRCLLDIEVDEVASVAGALLRTRVAAVASLLVADPA